MYPPAHLVPPNQAPPVSAEPPSLMFYDATHHTGVRRADFGAYLPSPDNVHAVMSGNASRPGVLAVILALDPSPPVLITGYNPAWSPDGQQLLYARQMADNFGLHVYDLVSGTDHALLVAADPAASQLLAGRAIINAVPTWSPTGDWLAVLADSMGTGQYERWVALIRPDGSRLRILPPGSPGDAPTAVAFSADGRLLAVDVRGDNPAQAVAIYSVEDGSLLHLVPGVASAGWSPTGHMLAITGSEGVGVLREPGDPDAASQPLGAPGCSGVVWKP